MTVAPNPVLIHRSRLPFRYPRRSLLRWYGPAANTSASSASANFNITSRTLPRNASLNRSGPKRPSIWLKHCILFPIGVFLLGLTLPMSQILFWDTERIRLLYFPQQAGRRPRWRSAQEQAFSDEHVSTCLRDHVAILVIPRHTGVAVKGNIMTERITAWVVTALLLTCPGLSTGQTLPVLNLGF